MTIFHVIVLGVVEGFTEFLPISSTAHLVLVSELFRLGQSEIVRTFEIAIQSGAMLAVLVFYWRKFLEWEMLKRIAVAFIPTAIIGLLLYKVVKQYLLGSTTVVLWSLLIGGIALIMFERYQKGRESRIQDIENISYKQAFTIGLFQSLAIVPGVSRSAATIVGGLLLGISRSAIVEFSFLLAVPTMAAATGLDLLKSYHTLASGSFGLLAVGFVTAFVSAFIAIKFLISYIQKHTFTPFGVYRVMLALVFLTFLI